MTTKNLLMTAPAAGGGVAAVDFLQFASSGSDLTTYTFPSQNIGTADADRTVVVAVGGRRLGTAAYSISSVTVAGVSATQLAEVWVQNGNGTVTGIYAVDLASGTTGDVVVTFSAASLRCGVALYRCTGISTTPNDTAALGTASSAGPLTLSVDTTSDGAVIAAACVGSNQPRPAWTGFTKHYDTLVESSFYDGASGEYVSAATVDVVMQSGAATIYFEHAAVAVAW